MSPVHTGPHSWFKAAINKVQQRALHSGFAQGLAGAAAVLLSGTFSFKEQPMTTHPREQCYLLICLLHLGNDLKAGVMFCPVLNLCAKQSFWESLLTISILLNERRPWYP